MELRGWRGLCLALIAVILAGCGGQRGAAPAPTPTTATAGCSVVSGGHMGVCTPRPLGATKLQTPLLTTGSIGFIHDLYEGNYGGSCGAPLGQAPRFLKGVIVKAYEGRPDSCFARYWHILAALHIWHAAYLFAHGCGQAAGFVATIRSAGGLDYYAGPPIIDAETPDARGSVACLAPAIHRLLGVWPLTTYTAPGTWPGGGDAGTRLWAAAYGTVRPCVWTCAIVAWQFTDGNFGPPPHSVGPFHGDLSLDFGLTLIWAHPRPTDPLHYLHLASPGRGGLHGGPFPSPYGRLDERSIAERYDQLRRTKANVKHLELELRYLAGRVLWVAQHAHDFKTNHRGERFQLLIARAAGRRLA